MSKYVDRVVNEFDNLGPDALLEMMGNPRLANLYVSLAWLSANEHVKSEWPEIQKRLQSSRRKRRRGWRVK